MDPHLHLYFPLIIFLIIQFYLILHYSIQPNPMWFYLGLFFFLPDIIYYKLQVFLLFRFLHNFSKRILSNTLSSRILNELSFLDDLFVFIVFSIYIYIFITWILIF